MSRIGLDEGTARGIARGEVEIIFRTFHGVVSCFKLAGHEISGLYMCYT